MSDFANYVDDGREIADPGEENQRTQIQQLNDVRKQISEVRTKGHLKLTEKQRMVALRSTVAEYITLLQAYLRDPELQSEEDPALWDEREIAKYTVTPPEMEDTKPGITKSDIKESPQPVEITLEGVVDILKMGVEYPVSFEYNYVSVVTGGETVTMQKNGAPSEEALTAAVAELDVFRRRTGLGLQLEDETAHMET